MYPDIVRIKKRSAAHRAAFVGKTIFSSVFAPVIAALCRATGSDKTLYRHNYGFLLKADSQDCSLRAYCPTN